MNRLLMLFCGGLLLALGLASCSMNNSVEVQSAKSDDNTGPAKPAGPGQQSQPSQPGESTQPGESGDPNDPMFTMKGFADGTLGAELEGFSKIKVDHTDWSNGPENKTTKSGEITKYVDMREVFRLTDPKQKPKDAAATCMFSHMADFVGNGGEIIGRVGVCTGPSFRENHPAVLVKFSVRGKMSSRQGITISNAQALADAIEKHATH